jgi:DNA topoisomerase I
MTYTVVIVESPAKCQKIEKFLGPGYKCIASYGHIRELNGLNSINISNNFKPSFNIIDSKNNQISKMRKMIQGAKEVMLAADDDREGEAIAWHICETFELPVETTKRIIFHEITETALKKAVKDATVLNMNIIHAQQARQILDLIVGFKLSPILWQKISYKTKKSLSAGRCQTPALRLIYDNQKEIDVSPGRKVYNTTGYFTSKNLGFTLNFNHEGEEAMTTFLEESVNHDHVYNCGKVRNTTKTPPLPLTTSAIQQLSSNELRISPKNTMAACQKLYEGGYITYMRTDSTTYCIEFIHKAAEYIKKEYGDEYVSENIEKLAERKEEKTKSEKTSKKAQNAKKAKKEENNVQEAHEAIRPTNIECVEADKEMGSREVRLYSLIRRVALESCMPPAKYNALTASVTAPEEHTYKYSTEQVVFPGFKIVAGYEKESSDYAYLQTIKSKTIIDYKKLTSKVSMKDLKSHHTEAKLVQLLEQNGIGRPSTFSSLIDKIQEREYVKCENVKGKSIECIDFELEGEELSETKTSREFGNEKNKLVIQPLGILVIEFLIKHYDDLFQYEYTKSMEDTLDLIAKGNKIWHELCKECFDEINRLTIDVGELKRETIELDNNHTYMIAKYGPVIKCVNGDKTTFKSVCDDIDIDKLRRKEYKLNDIIVEKKFSGKHLGVHDGKDVIIKKGKYGLYVEWGDVKKSITTIAETEATEATEPVDACENIKLENVIKLLTTDISTTFIRKIDDNTSIRTGKYGDYIFHKKPNWKKPSFLKLNKFIKEYGSDTYKTCDLTLIKKWIYETYKI